MKNVQAFIRKHLWILSCAAIALIVVHLFEGALLVANAVQDGVIGLQGAVITITLMLILCHKSFKDAYAGIELANWKN